MADRESELAEALAEKDRIYQRLKEVRSALCACSDGAERLRQAGRLRILRDMYREALERCVRLRPPEQKRRAPPRKIIRADGLTWDFFERSGAVWSDLEGRTWNSLGQLAEEADANGMRLLLRLLREGTAALTERQQLYIAKCFVEKKSISQAAEEMGVNRATVSRVVRAGLKRLEDHVVSCLYALECVEGDTFDHLRWAAATESLTERQRELLYYLLSDATLGQISRHLEVQPSTVSRTGGRITERIGRAGPGLAAKRPSRVIRRRDWVGKSEDEIAAQLGIAPGTYYRCICRRKPVNDIPRFAYECLRRRHMDAKTAAEELGCRPETVRRYWQKYSGVDVSKLDTPAPYVPQKVPRRRDLDLRRLLTRAGGGEDTIGAAVDGETYRRLLALAGKK